MSKMRNFVRVYWPILVILPTAYLISVIVSLIGDPWSAGEWGSNVVLAILITVATVMLTRRQGQLQENAADLELDEKIAVLSGSLDGLERESTAGRMCQVINDGKAGLNLIGSAHPEARAEYVKTLVNCLEKIEEMMTRNLYLYTLWTAREWKSVSITARAMMNPLDRRPERAKGLDPEDVRSLSELTVRIADIAAGATVPLDAFSRQYKGSDIRVQLDWARLEEDLVRIDRNFWIGTSGLQRRIFAPWYKTSDGEDAPPEAVGAVAVRLDQFASWHPSMDAKRQRKIEDIVSDMDHARPDRPYRFEIVSVELWGERLLILDGNHRLAAAFIRDGDRDGLGRNVEIVEYRLHVEPSVGLLRDLGWHLRTGRSEPGTRRES